MYSLIRKVKEIKDLILVHLQHIHDATQVILQNQQTLLENQNVSFENEATLLNSSKHTIKMLQAQNAELLQQIQYLQNLQQECRDAFLAPPTQIKNQIAAQTSNVLNPETTLIGYLFPYLPHHRVLDIGANVGEFSEQLLLVGYEVYAFEPFPPVFHQLKERCGENPRFHGYEMAIGAADSHMDLHLVTCSGDSSKYDDPSVYSSLKPHAMPQDLAFTETVQVAVRSLESLHRSQEISTDIALVKIDTEGFDLEVIRGMGTFRYPVVVSEFWDRHHFFRDSGALSDLVREMRQRDYHWYIVMCRDSDTNTVSYYCNYDQTPDRSWGNAFFFQDYNLFTNALKWCAAVLPQTYLVR